VSLGLADSVDDPHPVPAAAEDDAMVQLFATVPHDLAHLRRLASDNQW
jgi:hypothetical protein